MLSKVTESMKSTPSIWRMASSKGAVTYSSTSFIEYPGAMTWMVDKGGVISGMSCLGMTTKEYIPIAIINNDKNNVTLYFRMAKLASWFM